jgi:DNA repair protein RadC/predicted RNA methylase
LKSGEVSTSLLIQFNKQIAMKYSTIPEVVLGNIPEIVIPEIQVTYDRSTGKQFFAQISTSSDVAHFIRSTFKNDIELQEQMIVLYLNQSNHVIGYYKHSRGSISATVADIRIILGVALRSASVACILSHNHPSGNTKSSRADDELTKKFKEAAALMDIKLLDHLIVTKESYLSFADEGLLGLEGIQNLSNKLDAFVNRVETDLKERKPHNKLSIEKLAVSFGITDKTEVKELTELAIVKRARGLAHEPGTIKERFDWIVELYNSQVNLSHRTSQSILLQQYSTPAPIAYLAGVFCELDKLEENNGYAFEPSAGNGLLTIAGNPERIYVNEIDTIRNRNLQTEDYKEVRKLDATGSFSDKQGKFIAMLTNPPFGKMDTEVMYDTFPIKPLEHVMALRALDTMASYGKAAIIIGGHTKWDDRGRIQAGKNRIFFNYLYSRYYVVDVINIDGGKLYSRQGTSFDVRLILVNGRKQTPAGAAPVFDPHKDREVKTFDELYERVMEAMDTHAPMKSFSELETEAIALQTLFDDDGLGAPYEPASEACIVLNTQVPDSMAFETRKAILDIKAEVGGDIDNFVRHRLKYKSKAELCKVLSAEQIDAVAMAIYNIEARGQGMIIGDQTGIGKGRVAAAMIRYAVVQGHKPVFLTEKANLFSDIYRDLSAIGSSHFKPFIVN